MSTENKRLDALKQVKSETNLIHLAKSMGYTIDKKKSTQAHTVLEKYADKVVCKQNQKGQWIYFSTVDDKDHGTVIDFMLNRGYTYRQIRSLATSFLAKQAPRSHPSLPSQRIVEDSSRQEQLVKQRLDLFKASYEQNYLEIIGIQQETYKLFASALRVNKNQAIFPLYKAFDQTKEGRLCSTITYVRHEDGENRKYFQKGLPRGLCMLKEEGFSRIVLTESPIDALSHKQLHPEQKCMYLCTCGSLTNTLKQDILCLIEGKKNIAVDLCFDNDRAGHTMKEDLSQAIKQRGGECQTHFPTLGKDWHEELQSTIKGMGFAYGL